MLANAVFLLSFSSLYLSWLVIADRILTVFSEQYLFFNSLAEKFSVAFDSLIRDSLIVNENTKSSCKDLCNLTKKGATDPVPVKGVIELRLKKRFKNEIINSYSSKA